MRTVVVGRGSVLVGIKLVGVGGIMVRVAAVVAVGTMGITGVVGMVVSTETQPVNKRSKKIWKAYLGLNIVITPDSIHAFATQPVQMTQLCGVFSYI